MQQEFRFHQNGRIMPENFIGRADGQWAVEAIVPMNESFMSRRG
jgi:hypothetical protein